MTRLSITLLLGLTLLGGCRKQQAPPKEEHTEDESHEAREAHSGEEEDRVHIDPEMLRDLRITTAPVERRAGGEGVTVLGELGVDENTYAEVATPLTARISRVHASAGDTVEAKQPLVTLEAPEIARARAALTTAKARANAARATANRKKALAEERIVAARDVEAAEAEAIEAEAEVEAARSTMGSLGADLESERSGSSQVTLRSPVAGTVIERNALVGQMADPSRTLFRVGNLSRLWLIVHAFERDALRIKEGTEARLSFAALPGQTFTGTVTLVGAHVERTSRTVPVRIEVDNSNGNLKPGMSASAYLPVAESGALLTAVPTAALQRLQNGWYVFLPTAEAGAFERREVGRGRTLGGEVEILSGLKEGEQVVVEGAFVLKAEFDKSRGEGGHHEH